MATTRRKRLPELLVERGLVTAEQLRQAQAEVKPGTTLESIIVDHGWASAEDVYKLKAEYEGVKFVKLSETQIDEDVLNLVDQRILERHNALPIARAPDGGLVIVMEEPGDLMALDDIKNMAKCSITPCLAVPSEIRSTRERLFGGGSAEPSAPESEEEPATTIAQAVDEVVTRRAAEGADFDAHTAGAGMLADLSRVTGSDEEVAQSAPIIRIVNMLIRQAIKEGASDVHIEPLRRKVRIRFRIDGDLYEVMSPPKHVHAPLISRMKILADMDIAERRLPQDGRVAVRLDNKNYDLRVSVIPTTHGEKCVFRILDQQSGLMGLDKLGFMPDTLAQMEQLIVQPNGIILSTGPTGHGKTTTQYAILNKINTIEKNIITIEDPVEYQLPGVSQVPVNRKAGLTFANALRSFLRQDPDIILVGEIRDLETADIAIEASLTGHLVLSTLHTNTAPSAVTRLVDMGVEPFLISASVLAVLGQRLVRRVCENCKEEYDPPRDLLLGFGWDPDNPPNPDQKFYRGRGCEKCRGTGYKGRMGIFELFAMNDEIRELIVRRAPLSEIEAAAKASGMKTLKEDAFRKVLAGYTNVEEIVRKVMTVGA